MKHLELLSGYSATELMKKLQPAGLCGDTSQALVCLKKTNLRTKAECTKQSKKEKRVAGKRRST